MPGEFLDLDTFDVQRLHTAVATAVEASYVAKPCRRTSAEDRRRTLMCIDLFRMWRRDLRMSLPKICDHLHLGLAAKIDGVDFNPNTRNAWLGS